LGGDFVVMTWRSVLLEPHERDHDFRFGLETLLGRIGGGFEDGAACIRLFPDT
jgi:hypothetical protein